MTSTLRYIMRAQKPQPPFADVTWSVYGSPDNTGEFSGYGAGFLINIYVDYTVNDNVTAGGNQQAPQIPVPAPPGPITPQVAYVMKALLNTSEQAPNQMVTWKSEGAPDWTGALSGFPISQLSDIIVDYTINDTVTSGPQAIPVYGVTGPAGGDLSGTYPNPEVVGLQGRPISNTAPTTNEVLTWNGTTWIPEPTGASFVASQDLSGTAIAQTVIGIQDRPVLSTAPTTGQVLEWNGSAWAPASGAGGFIAGGDLSGTSSSQKVIGIDGYAISGSGPTNGQILEYNGTNVIWTTPSSGVTFAGDLSGNNTSQTVVGLQTVPVSNATPTNGEVLSFNGTDWLGTTPSGLITLAGDVTGLATANTVVKINGTSVPATPTANQVLVATSGTAATWQLIANAEISASAAIAGTKVSPNFGSQNIVTTGSLSAGVAVVTSFQDTTLGVGIGHYDSSGNLTSSLVVNADVSGSAAIAGTKISPNFGSQNVVTTGTLGAGATTVTSLQDSALGTGVVHSDSSGNFTSSLIVNADISSSAAVAVSKLAPGTSGQVLMTNGTPATTWTTIGGDATISATGSITNTTARGLTSATTIVSVSGATAPSSGQVLTATSSTTATWQNISTLITMSGDVTGPSSATIVGQRKSFLLGGM